MKGQFKFKKKNNFKFFIFWLLFFIFLFFSLKNLILEKSLVSYEFYKKWEIALIAKKNLVEENRNLKRQILFFQKDKDVFYNLKRENKELKERLNYLDFLNKKRVLFDILSQKDVLYGNILILDKRNFLKKGDLIFSKYNLIIGEVIGKIQEDIKKIRTFDSLGYKDIYKIFDGGTKKIEIEGEGMGSGIIKVITSRNLSFENKEKVYLVHKNNDSYLVAKLVNIEFKKQDTNKILFFKMLVNLELLSRVESEIIKGNNE